MASNGVVPALIVHATVTEAFGSMFPDYPDLVRTIGLDFADCPVANVGVRGDGELISIGNAAARPPSVRLISRHLYQWSDMSILECARAKNELTSASDLSLGSKKAAESVTHRCSRE